jgi:hypothetical protein
MIIDYLSSGARECPLIRLFGNDHTGFVELKQITSLLSHVPNREDLLENYASFHLSDFDSFCLGNMGNFGVQVTGRRIEWRTSPSNWHTISLLIEPLVDAPLHPVSYQWLWGPAAIDPLDHSETSVLLSKSVEGVW